MIVTPQRMSPEFPTAEGGLGGTSLLRFCRLIRLVRIVKVFRIKAESMGKFSGLMRCTPKWPFPGHYWKLLEIMFNVLTKHEFGDIPCFRTSPFGDFGVGKPLEEHGKNTSQKNMEKHLKPNSSNFSCLLSNVISNGGKI